MKLLKKGRYQPNSNLGKHYYLEQEAFLRYVNRFYSNPFSIKQDHLILFHRNGTLIPRIRVNFSDESTANAIRSASFEGRVNCSDEVENVHPFDRSEAIWTDAIERDPANPLDATNKEFYKDYYSYWQVFQVFDLMNMAVKLTFNFNDKEMFNAACMFKLDELPLEKLQCHIPLRGMQGYNKSKNFIPCFEVVSLYLEQRNYHINKVIPRSHYGKRYKFTPEENRLYRAAEENFSQALLQKYNVTSHDLIEFIKYQCTRWEEFSDIGTENQLIAHEYKENIRATVLLYKAATNDDYKSIVQLVGTGDQTCHIDCYRYALDRVFIDWKWEALEQAQTTFEIISKNLDKFLSENLSFSDQDVINFINWLNKKGYYHLYLIVNETLDFQYKYSDESLTRIKSNLKRMASELEIVIKELLLDNNDTLEETLPPSLKKLWQASGQTSLFQKNTKLANTSIGLTIKDCIQKIDSLPTITLIDEIHKKLLCVCLIRNYTQHLSFAGEEEDLLKYFVIIIEVMLLSWKKYN